MEYNNHDLFDKRLRKPKVYRVKDQKSDITTQQIETYPVGTTQVKFYSPNIIALFLNKSQKELDEAIIIYDSLIKPIANKKEVVQFNQQRTVLIFDYLEHIQTSIITLYSGIESLVNVLIPKDYVFEEITNKGVKEVWNKSAIERWKPTSEKLTKILPEALRILSPNTFEYWSEFKEFEYLRNSIIHVKDEILNHLENDKKIIGLLLNKEVFNKIQAAKKLIEDLSKLLPGNHEYPIMYDVEDLIVIEVDSWNDVIQSK